MELPKLAMLPTDTSDEELEKSFFTVKYVAPPPPPPATKPKPQTGRAYCAAKWCNNRKCPGIRMFRFPKDRRKELWVAYANRPEFLELPDSKIQLRRLCSAHFDRSAFMNDPPTSLKRNAIPSVPVTNKRLQFLVPPAFFQDPSLPPPKKDVTIVADASEKCVECTTSQPKPMPTRDSHITGQKRDDRMYASPMNPLMFGKLEEIQREASGVSHGGTAKCQDKIILLPLSVYQEIVRLKGLTHSSKLQSEVLTKNEIVEEQLFEDQSSPSFVPSPLELALVPEQFGEDASVDTCCSVGMADLNLSIGLELAAGITRTVAQQTENRDPRASSYTTFVCLLNKEGASTQVSHEQSRNVIDQSCNSFLEEPLQSHISYLVF